MDILEVSTVGIVTEGNVCVDETGDRVGIVKRVKENLISSSQSVPSSSSSHVYLSSRRSSFEDRPRFFLWKKPAKDINEGRKQSELL
jgi:hypothetical protein